MDQFPDRGKFQVRYITATNDRVLTHGILDMHIAKRIDLERVRDNMFGQEFFHQPVVLFNKPDVVRVRGIQGIGIADLIRDPFDHLRYYVGVVVGLYPDRIPDQRFLLPASALLGGAFLVLPIRLA